MRERGTKNTTATGDPEKKKLGYPRSVKIGTNKVIIS
mgnify:CR=1 FL=1